MVYISDLSADRDNRDDFGLFKSEFVKYNWYNRAVQWSDAGQTYGLFLTNPYKPDAGFTDRQDNPVRDYKRNKAALKLLLDELWDTYAALESSTLRIQKKKEIDDLTTYINAITKKIKGLQDNAEKPGKKPGTTPDDAGPETAQKGAPIYDTDLIYNVGCVDSAYFSQEKNFAKLSNIKLGTKPGIVANARDLWSASAANKGMIVLTVFGNKGDTDILVPSGTNNTLMARYGFQFHYNPGSIEMSYTGVPPMDINYVATQDDPFNVIGVAGSNVTQSTITFDIVLNRTMDHQYYSVPLGNDGRQSGRATLTDPTKQIYSPRNPDAIDQVAIWQKGTMYDVEFLLRTIMGFAYATELRGVTADVGWLSGRPVDLHLGQSLRYRCFISGFNVRHVIFNERMVPIFSTVSLSFNRLPDVIGQGNKKKGQTKDAVADPGVNGVSSKEGRPWTAI
jgi:hypothetical protein